MFDFLRNLSNADSQTVIETEKIRVRAVKDLYWSDGKRKHWHVKQGDEGYIVARTAAGFLVRFDSGQIRQVFDFGLYKAEDEISQVPGVYRLNDGRSYADLWERICCLEIQEKDIIIDSGCVFRAEDVVLEPGPRKTWTYRALTKKEGFMDGKRGGGNETRFLNRLRNEADLEFVLSFPTGFKHV